LPLLKKKEKRKKEGEGGIGKKRSGIIDFAELSVYIGT